MSYERLRKPREFQYVYKHGKKWIGKYLLLIYVKNNNPFSRIGIVTSKKVGRAVVRNKIKRRLREIVRLNISKIPSGYDIVVVSKSRAKEVNFWDLREDLLEGFRSIEKDEKVTPYTD